MPRPLGMAGAHEPVRLTIAAFGLIPSLGAEGGTQGKAALPAAGPAD
jgi:hypothetical protein